MALQEAFQVACILAVIDHAPRSSPGETKGHLFHPSFATAIRTQDKDISRVAGIAYVIDYPAPAGP